MTAYPIPENFGMWWLTTRISWDRLHAIPGDTLTWDDIAEAIDEGEGVERQAACGSTLTLVYSGLGSRFGLPRCAHCCRRLGIPAGDGTPCNEQGLAEQQRAARMLSGPPGVGRPARPAL